MFLGSALWWLLLNTVVGLLRGKIDSRRLRYINRLSGIILFAFGLLVLFSWTK